MITPEEFQKLESFQQLLPPKEAEELKKLLTKFNKRQELLNVMQQRIKNLRRWLGRLCEAQDLKEARKELKRVKHLNPNCGQEHRYKTGALEQALIPGFRREEEIIIRVSRQNKTWEILSNLRKTQLVEPTVYINEEEALEEAYVKAYTHSDSPTVTFV